MSPMAGTCPPKSDLRTGSRPPSLPWKGLVTTVESVIQREKEKVKDNKAKAPCSLARKEAASGAERGAGRMFHSQGLVLSAKSSRG